MRLLVHAIFTIRYLYGSTYNYIIDAVTSLSNNFSITQWIRSCKYRRFLINISRFEDILDLEYMLICFLIIKHTISYEFIRFTHTMMIGQLHTYPIDLYVKHAHLYNVKYRLISSAYRCRRLCRHTDISNYFVRSRGCRDNGCWLYCTIEVNVTKRQNEILIHV